MRKKIDLVADMSNSIETPIDIVFLGGIDIGIGIDFGYPWKIDIARTHEYLRGCKVGRIYNTQPVFCL